MINQAYQTFTEWNQTGIAAIFQYPTQLELVESIFMPLLLFTVFIIALLASYFSQARRKGREGDFWGSFAAAGYFVVILAFVMSLMEGLINSTTLIITISVAIIGTILLLISRD